MSSLIPGALALVLADHLPWKSVFVITALFMLPGIVNTLLVAEPKRSRNAPRTLTEAVVEPFHEFITRSGWHQALLILGFIFLYNLGASMATALATPFYLDIGFTKSDIGLIAKNAGLWASVGGGLLGGLWMIRIGINRGLWLFGAVQLVSILGFALLAHEQRADRQEQPLFEPDAPLVLADRREQEPHRGPPLLTELALVEEVDNDRDRRRRHPGQHRDVREPKTE